MRNPKTYPSSVVVIPTLNRPEFLALALEKLSLTEEAEHLDVRIFLDTCPDSRAEEVEYVRDTFLPTADIYRAGKHVAALSGCWNILHALREGYETGAEFIFLVEEDVMVRPNFFKWHWATQASDDFFVTCGRRHGRMPVDFYCNPGTCYRWQSLGLVVPHICKEYFADNKAYLQKHFPKMDGLDGNLDDGLIRKVIRSTRGKVRVADPAIVAHQGFHYYNRLNGFVNEGRTIQEKIGALREMLTRVDPAFRYTADFEPF